MLKPIIVSLLLIASSPTMNENGKCRIDWKEDSIPYFAKNGYKVGGVVDKVTADKLIKSALQGGVDPSSLKNAKIYFAMKGSENAGIGSFWIVDTNGCLVARAMMTLKEAMDIFGKGA